MVAVDPAGVGAKTVNIYVFHTGIDTTKHDMAGYLTCLFAPPLILHGQADSLASGNVSGVVPPAHAPQTPSVLTTKSEATSIIVRERVFPDSTH